jgi:hypothetical protein
MQDVQTLGFRFRSRYFFKEGEKNAIPIYCTGETEPTCGHAASRLWSNRRSDRVTVLRVKGSGCLVSVAKTADAIQS